MQIKMQHIMECLLKFVKINNLLNNVNHGNLKLKCVLIQIIQVKHFLIAKKHVNLKNVIPKRI